MEETFQEKTEQPTERKIEEAKKKGKIAQSREIPSALLLLFSTVFLYFSMSRGFDELVSIYFQFVRSLDTEVHMTNVRTILLGAFSGWMKVVSPFFFLVFFVSIAGTTLQRGFVFSMEPIKVNLDNINPVSGVRRLFTKRSVVELIKSLAKVAIVAYVAYGFFLKEMPFVLSLPQRETRHVLVYLGSCLFRLSLNMSLLFLFIAGLDFLFQKWQYLRDLMMTRQELKEEIKEREGNPLVKARIRSLQRDLARRRMIEEVKQADVVITNPSTFAVALRYVALQMPAPKVVAKGAGFVAEKIKEKARMHGVPLFEDRPLARALFYSVKVGDYIPERFYLVIAEILAKVYRAKGRTI